MAEIWKMDGTKEELIGEGPGGTLTLKQAQKAVGGMVEVVPGRGRGKMMLANEEGLLLELSPNEAATKMVGTLIVGDVVVCHPREFT